MGYQQTLAEPTIPSPPTVKTKPTLARVNSVPIFSPPSTPVERIRRTNTPTAHVVPAVAPAATTQSQEQAPVQPQMTPDEARKEKKRLKRIERKEAKRQRKEAKRARVDAATTTAHNDASHQPQAEGCPAPAPQQMPVAEAMPNPAPSQPMTVKQEPGTVGPKVAAKKSAAKPSQRPGTAAPSNTANPPQAVKAADTPVRTEEAEHAARQQATQENLQRANTVSQMGTPQTANRDNRSPSLETALEKEMHVQPHGDTEAVTHNDKPGTAGTQSATGTHAAPTAPGTQAAPTAPGMQAAPTAPGTQAAPTAPLTPCQLALATALVETRQEVPGPKRRKEMTPEQKALHARYMRFSRSFDRPLDGYPEIALGHGLCKKLAFVV